MGTRELFFGGGWGGGEGSDKSVLNWAVLLVSQPYTFIKNHQTEHSEQVNFMVYK